jgi:predicted membrane channel-forming protein YqfA (hemolysin III family)
MRSTIQLFRLFNELIFVLLGGMLIWVGATNRFFFDPRRMAWLLLAGLVLIFGLIALLTRQPGLGIEGWAALVRGASLVLVGAVMLAMAWVPIGWVVLLLMIAGSVLVLRGLLGAGMALRTSLQH